MKLTKYIVAGIFVSASMATATSVKNPSGQPRFPATTTDALVRQIGAAGCVDAPIPHDPETWLRWGGAPIDHQLSAIRAVVDALSAARPPIDVAAAILVIARVESGWNPYSRNPASSACGLFQFVRATWEHYGTPHAECFDPRLNASTGVKHLMTLYETQVAPRLAPLVPISTESERLEWTYRLLYAYHYHGEASPLAPDGGTLETQAIAEFGMPNLQSVFAILKKATAVPATPRRRARSVRTRSVRARARHVVAG